MTTTIDAFLTGLKDCGLSLETRVINGDTHLVLSGNQEVIDRKPGIRKYIQANRSALIEALLAQEIVTTSYVTHEDVTKVSGDQPVIDDSCCLVCHAPIDEHDESTWRMSDDGYVFCLACWDSRNIANAEKAHSYLLDHDQPTDFAERLAAWQASAACAGCGGYDFVIDYDGLFVCPCVQARRSENRKLDRERAIEEKKRLQQWEGKNRHAA